VKEIGAHGGFGLRPELLVELQRLPLSHIEGAVHVGVVSHAGFEGGDVRGLSRDFRMLVGCDVEVDDLVVDLTWPGCHASTTHTSRLVLGRRPLGKRRTGVNSWVLSIGLRLGRTNSPTGTAPLSTCTNTWAVPGRTPTASMTSCSRSVSRSSRYAIASWPTA